MLERKTKGKFRQDHDSHWYFILEDQLNDFDNMTSQLGLLDFYDEEWCNKNDEFIIKFGNYRLQYPILHYWCNVDIIGQEN